MSGVSYTLAGAGHRPGELGGYSESARLRLVDFAKLTIDLYKPTAIISGMALGWDQALAEASVVMGIPFDAAVPFAGQEKTWPYQSIKRYRSLLSKARTVTTVCVGGYAPLKMQSRNEWMCDCADGLLALWNGIDGGTANCIRYTREKWPNKPVINAWGEWMQREVVRFRGELIKP